MREETELPEEKEDFLEEVKKRGLCMLCHDNPISPWSITFCEKCAKEMED